MIYEQFVAGARVEINHINEEKEAFVRFELQTKEEIEAYLDPLKKQHPELNLDLKTKSEFP